MEKATPVKTASRKRELSSPEFLFELKKQCQKVSQSFIEDTLPSSPSEEHIAEMSDVTKAQAVPVTPAKSTMRNITFCSEDLDQIAGILESTFADKLSDMVSKITLGVLDGLNERLDKLAVENEKLKSENRNLKFKVEKLEMAMDASEQYSRRNNVRISGIPESNDESTDTLVLQLADAIEANISIEEIDRSHRVGKPSASKPRDIIVKFTSYRSRRKLLQKRKLIKNRGYSRVFVNEDLTRNRSNILFQARKLLKSGHILGAWTSDGTILVKGKDDSVHRIGVLQDLEPFSTNS